MTKKKSTRKPMKPAKKKKLVEELIKRLSDFSIKQLASELKRRFNVRRKAIRSQVNDLEDIQSNLQEAEEYLLDIEQMDLG